MHKLSKNAKLQLNNIDFVSAVSVACDRNWKELNESSSLQTSSTDIKTFNSSLDPKLTGLHVERTATLWG
jgi:hypothetical protein